MNAIVFIVFIAIALIILFLMKQSIWLVNKIIVNWIITVFMYYPHLSLRLYHKLFTKRSQELLKVTILKSVIIIVVIIR